MNQLVVPSRQCIYCISGNFRVFEFSRISDFDYFLEVYNNNFCGIFDLSSSRNSRKLKPRISPDLQFIYIYGATCAWYVTINELTI